MSGVGSCVGAARPASVLRVPSVPSGGTAGGTASMPHSQEIADVSNPERQCGGAGPEMQPVPWGTVSLGPGSPRAPGL